MMNNAALPNKHDPFFSKRLSDLLLAVIDAPVTVVEAPAGYGKTTALNYLEEQYKSRADVFWFTGVKEDQERSWEQFCQTVSRFDLASGELLLKVGRPNRVNSRQIGRIIRGLTCEKETILFLDNFQVWQAKLDAAIISALLHPACEKLHIVIATQYFSVPDSLSSSLYSINRISKKDLALTALDIRDYFRTCCPEITLNDAVEIYHSTEGWPVAVALSLRGCDQRGVPRGDRGICRLLDEVFFDRLSPQEQELLLPFALFDAVTERQLLLVFPDTPPSMIRELIRRSPLIRFDPSAGVYYPHVLLQEFLRSRLDNAPAQLKTSIYLEAGKRHLERGDQVRAITCFYAVKAYENILALPLVNLCFAKIGDVPFETVAREMIENCPAEVFSKHFISLLRLAYFLFASMDFTGYDAAMKLALQIARQSGDQTMLGEWMVMDAFSAYPDARAMGQKWKKAYEALQRPCKVISPQEPFMFGCQSMWYMFYAAPGQGDQIGRDLQEGLVYYNKLTDGHAGGADILYKGELASMRGQYDEAQTLAHQAGYMSQLASQPTVTFGAALLLGRIAISRQDIRGLEEAIEYLENKAASYPFMQGSAMNRYMLDISRTMLRSMMLELNRIPAWALMGPQEKESLGIAGLMTLHAYVTYIIFQRKFEEALGFIEAMLSQDKRISNQVSEYYAQIGIAVCNMVLFKRSKAILALDRAMEISTPDSLISIFVHHRNILKILMTSNDLKKKHGAFIAKVMSVKKEFLGTSFLKIESLEPEDELPESLTNREMEVALLAAKGLRNHEIAKRICISEQTVKNHLRTVFEKLSIDRRAKLAELLKP